MSHALKRSICRLPRTTRPSPIIPLHNSTRSSSISLLLAHPHLPFSPRSSIIPIRCYAADASDPSLHPPQYLSETELSIFNKLKSELTPVRLEVQDISGGCGSMFGLDIVSPRFQGLSVIKQHQLVNKILAEEIKGWHGMQLKTKAA